MKPVSIFSERDFVNAMARDGAAVIGFDVPQLMSTPHPELSRCRSRGCPSASMTIARVRHLPVIEENAVKGIVSIGDLVKHRLEAKELEANVSRSLAPARERRRHRSRARQLHAIRDLSLPKPPGIPILPHYHRQLEACRIKSAEWGDSR
jgi:CBS domain-containing protein